MTHPASADAVSLRRLLSLARDLMQTPDLRSVLESATSGKAGGLKNREPLKTV
jgi:hypothetical protein